ncbi:phytanoyl-CoA dioxygenase family protein [Pseudomonas sp. zfem002]|uniref:phytanoyl-CoA dioxygenase family protein n=1 Tax=Pseudomonas sp. zfem002 TaxID=3078197 RepID=UPI002928720E|nr:phytanoyl-CoA dioxygenase family protein [Pseudomonas sp. zfem002]MDU9389029.1 phytanoyl-CoA dioxygenase family protein [Pseudomonas sp. zfem002]
MTPRDQLHRDGYILLRQAIPDAWLDTLRATFDAGARPSDQWSTPRGKDWLHSQLDTDPTIQQVCRLPQLLAAVGQLIGERFFISQIDGRDPLAGGGYQQLHRDLSIQRPGDIANALVFFDDYGPQNGSTRLIPGSHRPAPDAPPCDFSDESAVIQLSGSAGDILVFDVDLIHAGSLNLSGARRRSILVGYFSEPLYASHLETVALRNIHMDTSERFEPADFAFL